MYVSCNHEFRAGSWPITEHSAWRIRHECPRCHGYASVSMKRVPRTTVFQRIPLYWGPIDMGGGIVAGDDDE